MFIEKKALEVTKAQDKFSESSKKWRTKEKELKEKISSLEKEKDQAISQISQYALNAIVLTVQSQTRLTHRLTHNSKSSAESVNTNATETTLRVNLLIILVML